MIESSLEVLNEVARIATLDLELRPMLQRITDALAARFGWEFVTLVSIEDERFLCEALTTSIPTAVHVGYSRALGSGVVGEVAATGRPVLIDDVRAHPNYVETMPGARAELCVPVKHHGQIVAVLNLESLRPAAFRGQLPLLEMVSDQIAGAIASARMYDELRRRARLMAMMSEVSRTALEATDLPELLQRIVRYIEERFPLERAAIVLGPAEAANGPLSLVVPIRFRDEILGALHLESQSADVFTPATVLAFEAFADQVAGAIRLSSLTGQLEAKTRMLEDANEHLARAIETLHLISTQDGLTGVPNRRHFDDTLSREWRRAARSQRALSLLMIDIDFFKVFNDTRGHQAGDECLRLVARALSESLHRAGDVVARYGGEEFAVLLPETEAEQAGEFAEALREHVASSGSVTVSIGVATTLPPRDGSGCDDLVRDADRALYEAKRRGRNRVVM
ncbi:MAG TPA: diguanylate cyclase [Thermoanaerobaculia bacterium]|nr:diguanylate cyclase [Thermoanaerobaculia bacterium]